MVKVLKLSAMIVIFLCHTMTLSLNLINWFYLWDSRESQFELITGEGNIQDKFKDQEVVTLIWEFEKFYPAEDYHQNYYQNNFLRYLAYKSGCQREEKLNKIWN